MVVQVSAAVGPWHHELTMWKSSSGEDPTGEAKTHAVSVRAARSGMTTKRDSRRSTCALGVRRLAALITILLIYFEC
jgi:hypothetical protein